MISYRKRDLVRLLLLNCHIVSTCLYWSFYMLCACLRLSVGVCVCAAFILGRREMEPQLSKQVFNMLSGFSSLPGKHTHTPTDTHTAHKAASMALASVSVGY